MKLSCYENKIPEIFYSIQGEGTRTGVPSVFIRSSKCNLYCYWCDTDYTWNFENTPYLHKNNIKYNKEKFIVDLQPVEVAKMALDFDCGSFVLTGGEPMLQQKDWEIVIEEIRKQKSDAYFEIETNGTLLPESEFDSVVNQYNVSMKLANSRVKEAVRIKPKVVEFFAASEKAYFKFVLSKSTDLEEVLHLKEKYSIQDEKIILMPEGSTVEDLQSKTEWLFAICQKYGFRFSDRLHVRVFGSQRGV